MRWLGCAVCLTMLGFTTNIRAEDPTVFVRISSITELMNKAKYLAKMGDQGEIVEQVIGFVEAMDGPKGVEGIDTSRPIGMMATLENVGPDNPVLIMIPVADEADFVGLVQRVLPNLKKGKDGIYPIDVPGVPLPIFMRVAQKYAIITIQDRAYLEDKKLPNIAKVLEAPPESVASFHFRFDRVPEDIRNLILGQIENQVVDAKERKNPDESDAQRALRNQVLDYLMVGLKGVMTEGRELKLGFAIDPKKDELTAAISLTGKPGSKFAQSIERVQSASSAVLGVLDQPKALATMGLNLAAPSSFRKNLDPLVDDLVQQLVDQVSDANVAPLAEKLLKAVAPTLKAGVADLAFGFYGPTPDKKYNLLIAGKVTKGKDLEKAVKTIVGDLPASVSDYIQFDVATKDGVTLHELKVGDFVDDTYERLYGRTSMWLGTSEDRIFLGIGPDAKEYISRGGAAKDKKGPSVVAEVHLSQLAPALDTENADKIAKVVQKVFGKAGTDDDRIVFSITGGDALKVQITGKGKLIRFATELEKANRDD